MNTKNNKNSITIVMPVVFSEHKIKTEILCIENLCKKLKSRENPRLFIVGYNKNEEFIKWMPTDDIVIKILTNKQYNISKSVNYLAKGCTTDYFCFIHSDIEMFDELWIDKFISLNETLENPGVIGTQSHSDISYFSIKKDLNITQVLTVDGIMFFKTELLKKIGYFDEIFNGDCETGDFCLRAIKNNYKNYLISENYINQKHHVVPFRYKTDNTEDFMKHAKESQILFKERWNNFIQKIKNKHHAPVFLSNETKQFLNIKNISHNNSLLKSNLI